MSEDDNLQPNFSKLILPPKVVSMKIWKKPDAHTFVRNEATKKNNSAELLGVVLLTRSIHTKKVTFVSLKFLKKVSATRNHYSSTSIVCFSGRRLLFLLSINIVWCVKTSSWHHCSSEGLCVINLQHLVVHANMNECCLCACNNQSNCNADFRI